MSAFELRDLSSADAARLAEFGARTFYESFAADNNAEDMRRHLASAWSPEKQRRELESPDIESFVVADGEQWLAFAQVRAGQFPCGVPREGSIELWRFYVDQRWHGAGVAALLMESSKARARRRGASTLWLGVWERNARAQAFYRKNGFEKVGAQTFVVGSDPQTDDVLLCRL